MQVTLTVNDWNEFERFATPDDKSAEELSDFAFLMFIIAPALIGPELDQKTIEIPKCIEKLFLENFEFIFDKEYKDYGYDKDTD